MFNSLHHIALIVSDYEKSKLFYTKILPFKILAENFREDKNSNKLDLIGPGGTRLEIFSFSAPPPRPSRPEAAGLRHLAFSVDDIHESISYLKTQEVEVEDIRIDPYTGRRFTFFADPDGLPIELYEG